MNGLTKESAIDLSKQLAASLGDEWKTRVWNNLGWCWSAVSKDGLKEVYKSANLYYCDVNVTLAGAHYDWSSEAETPEKAYEIAMAEMKGDLNRLAKEVALFLEKQ